MATGAHTTAGMSVDEAFQVLGTGRINIAMYLILCLNFMYVPMHIFGDLFNTRIPPHHCKDLVLANDKSDLLNSSKKHSDQVVVARRRHGSYLVPERSDMPNTYGYFYNERTCHLTLLDPDEGNKTIECEFGHWFDTSYTGETIVSEVWHFFLVKKALEFQTPSSCGFWKFNFFSEVSYPWSVLFNNIKLILSHLVLEDSVVGGHQWAALSKNEAFSKYRVQEHLFGRFNVFLKYQRLFGDVFVISSLALPLPVH